MLVHFSSSAGSGCVGVDVETNRNFRGPSFSLRLFPSRAIDAAPPHSYSRSPLLRLRSGQAYTVTLPLGSVKRRVSRPSLVK